jgi:hypothetical protein
LLANANYVSPGINQVYSKSSKKPHNVFLLFAEQEKSNNRTVTKEDFSCFHSILKTGKISVRAVKVPDHEI